MPDTPHHPMRNAACAAVVALTVLCSAACSVRQDATGVSRTGILLWGFGDPPGVDWSLDGPRREVPDLPASRHPELPPRTFEPGWRSGDDRTVATYAGAFARRGSAIGDNRTRVSRFPTAVASPVAVRAVDRPLVPDRS